MLIRSQPHKDNVKKPIHEKVKLQLADSTRSEWWICNRYKHKKCSIIV